MEGGFRAALVIWEARALGLVRLAFREIECAATKLVGALLPEFSRQSSGLGRSGFGGVIAYSAAAILLERQFVHE